MDNNKPWHPDEGFWDFDYLYHNPDWDHHHHPMHRCADECDDQLAVFSTVGRGLRGDSYKVELKTTEDGHQYLEGMIYDAATNTWSTDWVSNTIDGGKLTYTITKNFANNPPTFTITFHYTNPSHPEDDWTETTPAIPYIPEEPRDVPDIDQLAKILGLTPEQLYDILADEQDVIEGEGFTGDNIKNYVDNLAEHIHEDMGFGDILINDGDADTQNPKRNTIKKWIDWILTQIPDVSTLQQSITNLQNDITDLNNDLGDLDTHIHEDMGFGTILVNDGDSDTQTPKRNTIKKWIDWLIGKLGFGDLINNFGNTGATTIKEYIQALIDGIKIEVASPVLYSQEYNVKLAFFNVDSHTAAVGSKLISNLVANSTPLSTLDAKVYISYYDILPMIDFDLEVNTGQSFNMDQKVIGVVCTSSGSTLTPLNFNSVSLPERTGTIKPPLLNPEKLSNSGFSAYTNKPWQIYTGVGDCISKDSTSDAWPWGKSNNAFFYIYHRSSGEPATLVTIDYGRSYNCSYNQAVQQS